MTADGFTQGGNEMKGFVQDIEGLAVENNNFHAGYPVVLLSFS